MPIFAGRDTSSERRFSGSPRSSTYIVASKSLQPRVDPRCGSQGNGATCDFDPQNSCCSQYGYCGNTSDYCQVSKGCQSGCITLGSPPSSNITNTSTTTTTATATTTTTTTAAAATTESLSYPIKIGIITGSVFFGVSLMLVGLFIVWRCRNPSRRIVNQAKDFESNVLSISSSASCIITTTAQRENRVCIECLQTKPILTAFPSRRITAGCSHECRLCRSCLEMKINVSLVQGGLGQISCPESGCNARLEAVDIGEFSSWDNVQQYLGQRQMTESRECSICVENKIIVTEFPSRPITDGCQHVAACKECVISTIRAAIDEGRWTNIICPLCPNRLEFKDIAEFASNEDFVRYDRLSTRHAMEEIPNFRWCLRESCDSGQIHIPGEQIMVCIACNYDMCYSHQRPWHTGLTCKQYDIQNARRLQTEEAAVRAVIRRTTRPCPNCRVNVEKVKGTCNHMTCRAPVGCGHEFCYECFVKWTGYGRKTIHKRTCSMYTNS